MEKVQRQLRRNEWTVRPVSQAVAEDLVQRYHYAKGMSNTATFRHGLFRRGDRLNCMGVAVWIPPTKGAAKAINAEWRSVLALSRLVILPGVPKNACSFLMAESRNRIEKDGRWKYLVTYADEGQGHTGAIYLADNWQQAGWTQPEAVYVDAEGRMVSRKAGPKTRTKAEMESLGYKCVGATRKRRFVFELGNVTEEMSLFGSSS